MVKKKISKFFASSEKIIALILVILAGGLVLLPNYQTHEGIKPEVLLNNVINSERYISTDKLANILVKNNETYLLIDVRDNESYTKYTLPNAINIPLATLLDEDSENYLNQDTYKVVLFSNDSFDAEQAWVLCTRLGYENINVLKGGINNWFNTIINPPKPLKNASAKEIKLYNSRKEASKFFGVVYPEQVKNKPIAVNKVIAPKVTPKKIAPIKKKRKMPVEGGC